MFGLWNEFRFSKVRIREREINFLQSTLIDFPLQACISILECFLALQTYLTWLVQFMQKYEIFVTLMSNDIITWRLR